MATDTPRRGEPSWRRRVGVALGVLAALALGAFLLRGVVVTALVSRALAERGVSCPRISVDVSWDLSRAEVAQTTCRGGSGERQVEVGLPAGATVELVSLRPRSIEVPEVTLSLSPAHDSGEIEDVAGALLEGTVPEPLARALDAFAGAAAQQSLPRATIAAVRVRRGARTLDAYGLVLEPAPGRIRFMLASIAPPTVGERRVALAGRVASLEGEATPSSAEVRGRIEVELELGALDLSRGIAFRVSGEGLDAEAPRYVLWVEESERLAALRERIAGLRATRAERLEHRQERVEGLVDRVHQLAERLRERTTAAGPIGADAGPPLVP